MQVKIVEPGFVPTTGFFSATSRLFESIPAPDAYLPYIKKQIAMFDAVPPAGYFGTEDDVAAAVFAAATDEGGLSRFRAGNDTLDSVRARRQSDAEYDAWRRARFAA